MLDRAILYFVILFFFVNPSRSAKAYPAYVTLTDGLRIMGERLLYDAITCDVFLGIPYAQPPIKNWRFEPPNPLKSTNVSMLQANKFGPSCMQPVGDGHVLAANSEINENCLYLNIFAPELRSSLEPIPIAIWVHGGGFYYGSANQLTPEDVCHSLVLKDIIVVTVNYRLGPFGFLSLQNISALTPNLGLLDLNIALEWVKHNAAAFGGDAEQITMIGHGAGASATSLLSISPRSKGLFHRSILMSGSSLAPWAVTRHSYHSTENLVARLKCYNSSGSTNIAIIGKLVSCLKQAPASQIVGQSSRLWSPVIDSRPTSVFPKLPSSVFPIQSTVPTILGYTQDEAASLVVKHLLRSPERITLSVITDRLLPEFISKYLNSNKVLAKGVLVEYFTGLENSDLQGYLQRLIELYSDFLFKAPILSEANMRSAKSKTYLYSFEKATPNMLQEIKPNSSHGADIFHLWSHATDETIPILSQIWSDFIKTGSIQTLPDIDSQWIPYRQTDPMLLRITDKLSMTSLDQSGRVAFWSTYMPQLENPTIDTFPEVNIKVITPKQISTTEQPIVTTKQATSATVSQTKPRFFNLMTKDLSTELTSTVPAMQTRITLRPTSDLLRYLLQGSHLVKPLSMSTITPTTTPQERIWVMRPKPHVTRPRPNIVLPYDAEPDLPSTTHTVPYNVLDEVMNETIVLEAQQKSEKRRNWVIMWLMVGLALVFFILFLVTVAAWAVWNRESYETKLIHAKENIASTMQRTKFKKPDLGILVSNIRNSEAGKTVSAGIGSLMNRGGQASSAGPDGKSKVVPPTKPVITRPIAVAIPRVPPRPIRTVEVPAQHEAVKNETSPYHVSQNLISKSCVQAQPFHGSISGRHPPRPLTRPPPRPASFDETLKTEPPWMNTKRHNPIFNAFMDRSSVYSTNSSNSSGEAGGRWS